MPLTEGTRLGSYEIGAMLGAGGMGEVYRARDTKLGRDVALKVLPALVARDPDRLARFRREAQVLASLNDPHIAQIYGFEDSDGTHALVMELVEGPTLAELIAAPAANQQGHARRIPDVLPIARQIASALETAHEQGIVHRDLKPANIKVSGAWRPTASRLPDGRPAPAHSASDVADDMGTVKVLDFGLAKAFGVDGSNATVADHGAANSPTMTSPAMTELGMILGTAAYMSPEQARGRPVDKRADIWAFGVVLFEMLTGRRLFDGETVSDTLAAVLRQPIDWSALPAETPTAVRRLLERCLDRDARQRLRDIGEARVLLSGSLDKPASAPVPAVTSRARGALPWTVAAVAALAAIGALGWALRARPPSAGPRLVVRAQSTIDGRAIRVALSRDGTRLAYQLAGTIIVRRTDELDGRPFDEDGRAPVLFSPDGQWLVDNSGTAPARLRKVPIGGGTAVTLCPGGLLRGGDWSDDGWIVFSSARGLMRVPASGGTSEALTTVDAEHGEQEHLWPQFLPNMHQVLFTVVSATGSDLAVLDLATRQYRRVAKGGVSGRYVPGGYLLIMRGSTLFATPFDATRLTVTGADVPVLAGISTTHTNGIASGEFAVSDAGLLAYFAGGGESDGTTLAWADRAGATRVLPGPAREFWGTGRLSPDGARVANTISPDENSDVWTMDVMRGALTRLTFGERNDHPVWTRDGRRVLFWSSRAPAAASGVYSVASDGSSRPALVFATDVKTTPTSISPDGRVILVDRANGSGQDQIFVISLSGDRGAAEGEPRPLHDARLPESNGQISPDGRWVAYQSAESGMTNIYVQPFPGPGPRTRVSTDVGGTPRWSADGRELYYWRGTAEELIAVAVPPGALFQPGPPRTLFRARHGTTWDVTPDRNRFLFEITSDSSGDAKAPAGASLVTVTNWLDELRRLAPAKK